MMSERMFNFLAKGYGSAILASAAYSLRDNHIKINNEIKKGYKVSSEDYIIGTIKGVVVGGVFGVFSPLIGTGYLLSRINFDKPDDSTKSINN